MGVNLLEKVFFYLLIVMLIGCSESKDNSSDRTINKESNDSISESVEDYNQRKKAEALARNKKEGERLKNRTSGQPKISAKWYEGGTLHKSKIGEWKNATEANKLATCEDFAAKVDNSVTMDVLLVRATELRACITEATRDLDSTNDENVSDIAVLCVVTLGYK